MIDNCGGLARIGIPPDTAGLIDWYEFTRTSGITSRAAKGVEMRSYALGSRPQFWFATYEAVPKGVWTAIQINIGNGWYDVPQADWASYAEELAEDVPIVYVKNEDDLFHACIAGVLTGKTIQIRTNNPAVLRACQMWRTSGAEEPALDLDMQEAQRMIDLAFGDEYP